jgi:hypothetical protein
VQETGGVPLPLVSVSAGGVGVDVGGVYVSSDQVLPPMPAMFPIATPTELVVELEGASGACTSGFGYAVTK